MLIRNFSVESTKTAVYYSDVKIFIYDIIHPYLSDFVGMKDLIVIHLFTYIQLRRESQSCWKLQRYGIRQIIQDQVEYMRKDIKT